MNKELFQKLENATARIESLLHIGGMLTDDDSVSDPLRQVLAGSDDEELAKLFPGIPDWVADSIFNEDFSEFAEWVYEEDRLGFLVEFATPVMRGDEKCRTYTWSRYKTCWVYAETLPEAVELGIEWVAKCRAAELRQEGRG